MLWGSGGGPQDEQRIQPGPDLHETPTPPYPFGRGPTPHYQPQPDGPAQRLADARRAGRRSSRQSTNSPNPDGLPAPLPASVLGVRLRGPGGTRVVQRFFGTGLTPATRAQRQERRAQRATALLAALALLVIAASAILIFDPSIELASFGFALNQRVHQQKSNAPLYVDGTQPPTPTSASSAAPQSTTAGSTPQPTATTAPTATPRPTFTPTPIPTVIPNGAVVKFKATTASISKNPNTFTGCGSGCDFQTANGSGSGALSSGSSFGPSGWQSTAVGGSLHVQLDSVARCNYDQGYCSGVSQVWYGQYNVTFGMGPAPTCTIYVPNVARNSSVNTGTCPWWWTTSTSYIGYGGLVNGGSASYTEWLSAGCSDSNPCGWFILWSFTYWNNTWVSQASYRYVNSSDCNNAINSADPNAKNAANSAANSWIGVRVRLYQSVAQISNSSVRYCSPGVGAQNTSTTGHVEWSWSATAFDPNAVVSAATNYVQSHVPSGYLLTSGPNTCTAGQAGASGNYGYPGGYNATVTVTCSASGTATYDWTADTQGTTAQAALDKAIEGQSLSQAQSICNGFQGVVAGSCTITLNGGNVQIVPSDPSHIQILAS